MGSIKVAITIDSGTLERATEDLARARIEAERATDRRRWSTAAAPSARR